MRTDPKSVIAICWNLPDEWIWLKRVAWQTRMCLNLIQGARKIQATYIVNPQFTLRTYNESSVYTQIFWHQSCRVSRMIVWKQKKWKITYLCKFLHFVFRFHIRLYCSLLLLFQNPKALSRFLDLYYRVSTSHTFLSKLFQFFETSMDSKNPYIFPATILFFYSTKYNFFPTISISTILYFSKQ